jgi:hypothetical protein
MMMSKIKIAYLDFISVPPFGMKRISPQTNGIMWRHYIIFSFLYKVLTNKVNVFFSTAKYSYPKITSGTASPKNHDHP